MTEVYTMSRSFLHMIIAMVMLGFAQIQRASGVDFTKEVKPILQEFCFGCHADGKKKGGFSFEDPKLHAAKGDGHKLWQGVHENLRSGAMPPDDEKQPTLEQMELVLKWIDSTVFATDPSKPDPGRVTIRRLNRTEYNNTIRDLVGVNFEPGADFPADDSGYGFDNIGDVLSLPPVLFERYLSAAEKIMSMAILNDHKPRPITTRVDLMTIRGGPGGATPVARKIDDRESIVDVDISGSGSYTLLMVAQGEKVGTESPKVSWTLNGKPLKEVELKSARDTVDTVKVPVQIDKAGKVTLAIRVNNPAPKEGGRGQNVRSFTIRKLEFISPPQAVSAPETQLRLFAPGRGHKTYEAASQAILGTFAKKAFRRPVPPAELARYIGVYQMALRKGGNFEQSVQTAMTAILVSPHFLFRGEFQPSPDDPKSVHKVHEMALASRLSYFLWSSMPDDALFAEAEKGTLRRNMVAQIRRMLNDPKATALVENFAGQWLQLRNLKFIQPDAKTFPDWDKALATAMEQETELLFRHIVKENLSVLEFLSADYTFVNERLARHYGIEGVEGEAFVKVKLPPNRPGGVLGHGGFLTLTSNPTRTSPVKRGKFVLENILGTPPPPPPPDVPDLNEAKRGELKGTLRERMEQHRVDPNCAGCHARMDPIGFGLENFNGIGAYRETDEGARVDAAGQLVSGEKFGTPIELRRILLQKKRTDFLRCLSEKMLTYALGRGLEYYDRPIVDEIVERLEQSGAQFATLINQVILSVPFQMRRGEGDHREFSGTGAQ